MNPPTTLALCSEERHTVAFDYFGTISLSDEDLGDWLGDHSNMPDPRPGVADVASAYRALGYEVLYITTAPVELQLGDQPLGHAIVAWLGEHGFPTGEGTALWVWDGNNTPMKGISVELERLVAEGVSVDAAYTDNEDKAFAFKTAVLSEGIFTLGSGASTTGSTPIPGDDMVAHLAEVERLDQVCRPG